MKTVTLNLFKNSMFCISSGVYRHLHVHDAIQKTVLGIETSCDETGAAVVNESGKILGEALASQMQVHLDYGGVIPHIASYLHEQNIKHVVDSALKQSGLSCDNITAIAVTTKPGLRSSLTIGLEYGKELAKKLCKPLIPVHHMEAHSLTVRMVEKVSFPYLVLLASGGHCQIAVVKNVREFLLLGTAQNNTPGEVLDKIARRLKLQNLPECSRMSGGQAIELIAENGNPLAYNFPLSLLSYRDCNFSFAGYGSYSNVVIEEEEKQYDVPADGIIPTVRDFCASLLHGYAIHMMHRVHRAFIFCDQKNLLPKENKILVFSGGVACNKYLRNAMKELCDTVNAKLVCPPPKLCTDNGIMIAWNGIEKLKENYDLYYEFENIKPQGNCPLGIDMTDAVRQASIKLKVPRLEVVEAVS